MRQWQKDALSVIREARVHATRTSNIRLHLACSRVIEAMVIEGGQVPSELRVYASQTREAYSPQDTHLATVASAQLVG